MKKFFGIALSVLLFVSCSGDQEGEESENASAEKQLTIGVMPKLIGIDYFNACEQGARQAGEELGIHVVYDGPPVDDVARQAEMIDSWIIRQFDAICIAPNDNQAIAPSLERAISRGLHAITWDAEGPGREYHVNMAKGEAIAHTLVDLLAEATGGEGEFAIITGRLTTANQNMWIEHIRNYVQEKFPGLIEVI